MAGIAGIVTADGAAPDDSALDAMESMIAQRSRFGTKRSVFEGVGLIEAVAAASEERGVSVLQDGYALIADGWQDGRSDRGKGEIDSTAKLDRHWLQAGADTVAATMPGGFAYALLDQADGSLTQARDLFGIKTVYYTENSAGFAFASEAETLLEAGFAARQINAEPRDELLQMQFCTGRETIYPGIQRVLPGETLNVFSGRVVSRSRAAALPEGSPANWSEEEALSRLTDALGESVVKHVARNGDYAVFLSGGIDSVTLLSALKQNDRLPRHVLTAVLTPADGMEEPFEAEFARQQARQLGIEHTEIRYGATAFWRHLPGIVDLLDDPTADLRVLPLYLLAREAAERTDQVLLGDGGDELFAGYGRYRGVVRPWFLGGPKVIRPRGQFDRLDLLRHEPSAWRDGIRAAESLENQEYRSKLQVAQAVDCADWLPNDVLLKLDRCLSHHGLEGHFPLLDHAVARVAFALPDGLKVKQGRGKYLLRRWLQAVEPEARPFGRKLRAPSPVTAWIMERGEELGPLVARQPGIEEIARPERVRSLFRSSGKRQGFAAWSLLFYALWHRRHVLGLAAEGDVFETLACNS